MERRPRTNITYIQHNQHDVLGTYSAQERVIRVIIYLRKLKKIWKIKTVDSWQKISSRNVLQVI
jgi:hypothetical protein